jgi:cation:H+ antiporter
VTLLLLVVGLVLLVAGAEALVRGASRLAAMVGMSPLVIGLTVVAYGTSAPELAVSVNAGLAGQSSIALGNVVGSNIFNVLFILGTSALIAPLVVHQQLVRVDVPILIGLSVLLWLLMLDGVVGQLDGALLVTGALAYTGFAIHLGRREAAAIQAEYADAVGRPPRLTLASLGLQGLWIAAGLGLLVLGAHWLVEGAVTLARALGVSDLVIGLTVIAAGTSLPEVATSIMATVRGHRDLAVGNVIGSNIFNLLAIVGVASLVTPGGLLGSPSLLALDLPVMTAVAAACLPIFLTGHVIERWEGAVFVGYYLAYTTYLVLQAVEPDALPMFSAAMLWFVVPLTVVTLATILARSLRQRAA